MEEMVAEIYKDVDKKLHGAAGWSVRAHLARLQRAGNVTIAGDEWQLVESMRVSE